ncbi:MAG: hypothetical protein ACSHXF_16175 [Aquaticitalea sp.]
MKFTTYYSSLIKANGVPHLNVKQHAHLMNIIVLEARITQLQSLKCEGESLANKNRTLFDLENKLKYLTHKEAPEMVMRGMIEQSE